MLYFSNPGVLDPKMVQIFGVSAKETENPIGFFGTGMKYAIAVTLRLGGSVEVWSGSSTWTFSTKKETIRGKDFDLIFMRMDFESIQLPFTLDLGKAWEPWMAYREFYSNAIDESGFVSTNPPKLSCDSTVIAVNCPAIEKAHEKRNEFILHSSPIFSSPDLEIHPQSSSTLFYRGIKVYQFRTPGAFTYNILKKTSLTEDRTLVDSWSATRFIQRAVAESNKEIISKVLTDKDKWEWNESWADIWYYQSDIPEILTSTVSEIAKNRRFSLPPSVIGKFIAKEAPPEVILSVVNSKSLKRAKSFCARINHPITSKVVVVSSLNPGVLGSVINNKIVLSLEAFQQGTKRVAGTLLEEQIHINTNFSDCTYSFQNYLIDLIMGLSEELVGEPL